MLRNVWLPIVGLLSVCVASAVFGQPTRDSDELERLIEALKIVDAERAEQESAADEKSRHVSEIGQAKKRVTPSEPEIQTLRMYDLSDLFQVSPVYPAMTSGELGVPTHRIFDFPGDSSGLRGSGSFGGGGGIFSFGPIPPQEQGSLPANSAAISLEELLKAIQSGIEPDEWKSGRASASILGNSLLITATESIHARIEKLLDLFRSQWGQMRTVSVQVLFVYATPQDAYNLLASSPDNAGGSGIVSAAKFQPFFDAAVTEKRIAYSVTLLGQNTQTLHGCAGRERFFIVGNEPLFNYGQESSSGTDTENENDKDNDDYYESETQRLTAFSPIRRPLEEGAIVQATPLCTRGGNFVLLDLRARVVELLDSESADAHAALQPTDSTPIAAVQAVQQEGKAAASNELLPSPPVDNPQYASYRMSTTLRCPKNEVVLAGAATFQPAVAAGAQDILVFVKCQIHTVTPDRAQPIGDK